MAPHNLAFTAIGTGLLFVGWLGFNAGSAWAADGIAAVAAFNTILAACAAAIGWTAVEWIDHRKPTLLGLLSGIVAGLVGIVILAGCSLVCLLALVPLYLRRGDKAFAALCLAEVAVVLLAASGWLSGGH